MTYGSETMPYMSLAVLLQIHIVHVKNSWVIEQFAHNYNSIIIL